MELQKYVEILFRSKWVILATMATTTLVAMVGSSLVTPRYSATATLRLASTPGGSSDYIYYYSLTRLSNTFVEIATSDSTLDKVAEQLGMPGQPSVQVDVVPETELIKISATDTVPARARDIANAVADILIAESQQIYGDDTPTASEILAGQLAQAKLDLDAALSEYDNALRSAQSTATSSASTATVPETNAETLARLLSVRQQIYLDLLQKYESARTNEQLRANALTIVEPANLPIKPSSPNKLLNTALGLAAGLAAGVILAFVFEGLDDTVRGIEDVQEMTNLPILCLVPTMKQSVSPKPPPVFSGNGRLAQTPAFDQLRARLSLVNPEPKSSTYLITSPEPGAGKSTVAANLAVSLADVGNRVVLIDMDFRRPRLHAIFNLENEKGVSNFFQGEIKLTEALQTTQPATLQVIVAGACNHIPAEWLTSKQIEKLLNPLRKNCDYLLIDTPAMLSVADPTVLASHAEAVIMVVAKRRTQRQNLRFALQQLSELKINVVGIVLNRMPHSQLYDYYAVRPSKPSISWHAKIKPPKFPKAPLSTSPSDQPGVDNEPVDRVIES